MKTPASRVLGLAVVSALVTLTHMASANEALWIGTNGVSATTNWSDPANFRNIGTGGSGPLQNAVVFDDSTGVADAVSITSVVDVNENPFSLDFTNFNTFQNMLIATGKTLTVSTGGLTNGITTTLATVLSPVVNISGTGAAMVVSNGNIIIGNSYPSASGTTTLNLTNLDMFTGSNITRILLGSGTVRQSGTLFGAKTNLINISGTTSPQLDVGDNTSNSGGASTMNLGTSNLILADNIAVGRSKQGGASIRFAPVFTNGNATVFMRGHDGVSAIATWSLGDGNGVSGTSTGPKGTVDFSGGTINVAVSNMWLGRPSITSATAPTGQGTLTFSAGNFTVINNLTNAVTVTPSTGGPGNATGTINVNGTGILTVNNTLMMAILGTGTTASTGTLNINYGTVQASNLVVGSGTSAINMVGGMLIVTNTIGTASLPVGSMTLSNSTIQIAASAASIPVSVNSLTIDGNSTDTNYLDITSVPTTTTFPATYTIIQSADSINIQNGTFNFALGNTLPGGYLGFIQQSGSGNAVQLVVTNGPSAPDVWTGADIIAHSNTNWSDGLNWSAGVAPGANSLVFFNTASSQSASAISSPGSGVVVPSKINNIVDANFSIATLIYTNINGSFENTFINSGDTLSVQAPGLTVGSATTDYGNTTGNVTISGPNGTLNVTNAGSTFYVGLGDANSGDTPEALLDMSGLGTFNANVVNLLTGVGGFPNGFTIPQPAGIIYLAKTNTITASSSQPDNADSSPVALEVGDADTLAGTVPSVLYLGMTNGIFADNIAVARQLASGGILFNPAFTNASPTAFFRGASASAVGTWTIGDGAVNTMSLTPSGTNDFTGGSVNALVNTMYVAKSSTASMNVSAVTGVLTFNAGNITANTLNVSFNGAASDNNVYSYGVGTVNVSGTGSLLVNTALNLGLTAGSLQGGSPVATLNITNGGTVLANTIVAGTNSATSVINLNGGTLVVTNAAGSALAPLTTLDVTNATIEIGVSAIAPTITATTLNLDGVASPHDTINILSLPPIASYPVTFTIIKSVNAINLVGGTFNFALGSLPASTGQPYAANITESSDNTAVLLTVTSGPIGVRPSVTWTGADVPNGNTNWTDRLNWQLPGAPVGSDNVIFDSSTAQGSSELGTVGAGISGFNFGAVNNLVDSNFTISSLTYTNVGGTVQNTYIADGMSLSVTNSGGLTVGSGSVDFGAGATGAATIAGAKGTLNVNNTNSTVFVGLGSGSATSENAVLDLSGLATFNATISRMLVGVGSSSEGISLARMGGTVYLAQTNNITVAQSVTGAETSDTGNNAVSFDIGDDDGNNGAATFIYLGQSNAIFADAIAIARQKETATMIFNPIFSNPSAYFRGQDGVSAVGTFDIANGVANSGTVTPTGTCDFSAGSVDALVTSMFIGRAPSASGDSHASPVTGVLTFGAGVINVASLFDGYEPLATSPFGVGTVNVNGPGSLIVGTLNLALAAGGGGAASTSGTLNIGGSVQAGSIVAGTNSLSTINMVGGALTVATTAGSAAAQLTSLSLSNSVLTIPAVTNGAINVTTLNLDGQTTTTNLINVSSVAFVTVPAEVPLIKYGSMNLANGSFNVEAVLPNGYAGFLTNDTANDLIGVVITTQPNFTPPVVTSIVHSGNNLVISGTNGLAGGNYTVLTTTNILTPKTNWTRLVTNSFSGTGTFSFTNAIDPNTPQKYFLFQVP